MRQPLHFILLFLGDNHRSGKVNQHSAAAEAAEDDKAQAHQGGVDVKVFADAGAHAAEHLAFFHTGQTFFQNSSSLLNTK